MEKTCTHCGTTVSGAHHCAALGGITDFDSDDFITSAAIGYVTNNALLGGLLGGDMIGGVVGDWMNADGD